MIMRLRRVADGGVLAGSGDGYGRCGECWPGKSQASEACRCRNDNLCRAQGYGKQLAFFPRWGQSERDPLYAGGMTRRRIKSGSAVNEAL